MTHAPAECEELRVHLERLRALLDSLLVRGLRACGADELAQLRANAEHLERAGAAHVAAALHDLHARVERDDRASAPTLLAAQTSVRLLERLLTLRVVRAQFEASLPDPAAGPPAATPPPHPAANPHATNSGKIPAQNGTIAGTSDELRLVPLLTELRNTVEQLVLAGLTAASRSTVERLDVTFKEASRMKLLRLGSTLRIANEEISRFTAGAASFSPRRLSFFLGRAWLLATAMRNALEAKDLGAMQRLLFTPPTLPLDRLSVVTLGVGKRVVPGAFASFDFRLRAVSASPPVQPGEALVWSVVFPMRRDMDIPAEAFLHLPQKQKFKPSCLLEQKVIEITKCAVTRNPTGPTRLVFTDATQLTAGKEFTDWPPLFTWDPAPAARRLAAHRPTPLDLEIELQEEVFLSDWQPGDRRTTDDGYDLLPIESGASSDSGSGPQSPPGPGPLALEARLDHGPSGVPLREVVTKLAARKRDRPPLFGTVHYESCRLLFQPLTALGKEGPEYLTVSKDKISQAQLVKAMKFT